MFGLAFGSFINVVTLRYDPNRFILSSKVIGGRSVCPNCKSQLRWYELIPLLSITLQKYRCRHCGKKISIQYPIVEFLAGAITALVPRFLYSSFPMNDLLFTKSVLWVLVFLTLLVISVIDFHERLIPDEGNIFLFLLGTLLTVVGAGNFSLVRGSFLDSHASLFGIRENIWVNHLFGLFVAAVLFGLLILITRGKGMGMGDLKLAAALGLIFGWPDILVVIGVAFVTGSVVGIFEILRHAKTMKSAIPFGPFLALSSIVVFFFGARLLEFYFNFLLL